MSAVATGPTWLSWPRAALPLPDDTCDVALAPHMLYHVPDPQAAVRELRRITRPGGQVLVVLNGEDHLRELRDAMSAAPAGSSARGGAALGERLRLDDGAELLAAHFRSVTRHDFTGELLIPGPAPVEDYLRSMITAQGAADPEDLVAAVTRLVPRDAGLIRIRTHSGCLVCT